MIIQQKWIDATDAIIIPRSDGEGAYTAEMYPLVRSRIVAVYKRLRRSGHDHQYAKAVIYDMVFAMYLYQRQTPVTFRSHLLEPA